MTVEFNVATAAMKADSSESCSNPSVCLLCKTPKHVSSARQFNWAKPKINVLRNVNDGVSSEDEEGNLCDADVLVDLKAVLLTLI